MNPRRDLKTMSESGEPVEESHQELGSNLEFDLGDTPVVSQRRFMNEHTTCAMCDTKLEIRHEINMPELKVKEEAHCPSCGIRVRSTHHLMH